MSFVIAATSAALAIAGLTTFGAPSPVLDATPASAPPSVASAPTAQAPARECHPTPLDRAAGDPCGMGENQTDKYPVRRGRSGRRH